MGKTSQQRMRKPVTAARSPQHLRPTATALAIAACFSGSLALANPTNPTVVNGIASFAQAGNILNITNSPSAIINWGSFSIGINELTRFLQQSASSAVLNRVIGQDPSAILGALQSNGKVFLLNPNGIVFGAGSQINVAGLVASTLNLSNEDFLASRMRFTDGAGAGSVVNQGSISGGEVYLVGKAVTNDGLITSPNGNVILAAGNSVELVNPGTPNLRVEIVAPDNAARNLGTITADAGRIGIYAGLIKQGGIISADSAVAAGGQILLKSTRSTTLEATSVISARGTDGGKIEVLSDMAEGSTRVEGTLDVSALSTGKGKGGFVETSGANVLIGDSTRVKAMGSNGGSSGMWLIDPENFTIFAGAGSQTVSGMGADTLVTNLGSTPVTISTFMGSGAYAGDINVDSPVSWSSVNGLTLVAYNDVNVNSAISNGGTGGINLYAGWDGSSLTSAPVISNFGSINLDAAITTAGTVKLVAGGDIGQSAPITAGQLLAVSNFGTVQLDAATNMVGTLAGSANNFYFENGQSLTIGSVGGVNGVTASNSSDATVEITVTSGNLIVNQNVKAEGGGSYSATVTLTADTGGITVNSPARVSALGGSGESGGAATVVMNAGTTITVNAGATVEAIAGGGSYSGVGNAVVQLAAPGGVTVNGAVLAQGGNNSGSYYSGGDATINLCAGTFGTSCSSTSGPVVIGSTGSVTAIGGEGGEGSGGTARITLTSSGPINVAGEIFASGGRGGNGGSYYGSGGNGGDAVVTLSTVNGPLTVAGTITAIGGQGGNGNYSYYGSSGSGSGGNGGNGGNATITLTANSGPINVSSAIIAASGGAGGAAAGSSSGGNGRGGYATVELNANSGNVTLTNSLVVAAAQGGADGAEGYVGIYASGTINSATSSVGAVGGTSADGVYGTQVYFNANGNITLGQVISNEYVYINSSYGGIIDGDSGLNIIAPRAFLIGSTGVGTITNPIETLVSNLDVYAYNGDIGIINSGDLSINALRAYNGNAAVGTTGTLTVDGAEGSASGDLSLLANGDINIIGYFGSVSASGDLLLNAGGNLTIGGSGSYNASAYGGSSTTAIAGGNLSVLVGDGDGVSPSRLGSNSGITTIKTGGNVLVDQSSIIGSPDVVMTVGGVVDINGTLAYGGTIEAGSEETIHLTFPMLQSGGFFVNGIEGVVFDPLTGTGFRADGSPAILGTSLLVTYGNISVPTDTLISAMGESITPPEPEKDKDIFEDVKDDKKKAPVCR